MPFVFKYFCLYFVIIPFCEDEVLFSSLGLFCMQSEIVSLYTYALLHRSHVSLRNKILISSDPLVLEKRRLDAQQYLHFFYVTLTPVILDGFS